MISKLKTEGRECAIRYFRTNNYLKVENRDRGIKKYQQLFSIVDIFPEYSRADGPVYAGLGFPGQMSERKMFFLV